MLTDVQTDAGLPVRKTNVAEFPAAFLPAGTTSPGAGTTAGA